VDEAGVGAEGLDGMSCTVGGGLQRRVKRYAGESERGRTSMVQYRYHLDAPSIRHPASANQAA